MANDRPFKEQVKECIDLGLVKKNSTVKKLRAIYNERIKEQIGYEVQSPHCDDLWGKGAPYNRKLICFINECAKQLLGLPAWPQKGADQKDVEGIARASRLGVAVEDLPFVDEAKKAGEFANYRKVRRLPENRHLPLRFYLDLVASGVRELQNFQESRQEMDRLYALACHYAVTGTQIGKALRREDTLGIYSNWLEGYVNTIDLDEMELLRRSFDKMPNVKSLYERGVISANFAGRYRNDLKGDWGSFSKITDNPLWDRLPHEYGLALYRGITPQQLANDSNIVRGPIQLTRREATEWLAALAATPRRGARALTPLRFLCDKLGLDHFKYSEFRDHSRTLLEWYSRKKDLPSMSKRRTVHGPGGFEREFCFNEILDEITEEDLGAADASLAEKLNANPEKVFAAASRRISDLYLAKLGEDVELPVFPLEKEIFDGIRQLLTSGELITEGREMGHCVGGYASSCIRKTSFIFSVATAAGRSTFEVCNMASDYSSFRVAQHHGRDNTAAPEANCELVLAWSKANGIHYDYQSALRCAA